jgi:AraC-like DNA-binding protein
MSTLQSSLFSAAIAICALCAFLASSGSSRLQGRHRFFVAWLIVEAAAFTLEWLMLHPTSPAKSLWLALLMSLSFLVAPCLWLFARDITEDQTPAIRSLPAHHFAIIAAGFVLTVPLMQTTHFGPYYWNPNHVPTRAQNLVIHGAMLACVLLFLIQVPYYLKKCVQILSRHVDHTKALFSNIEHKSLNMLRILVAVVVTKWFVSLLRVLYCVTRGTDTRWGWVAAATEVSVTIWALFFVMRQSTLFDVGERKLVHELFGEPAVPPTSAEAKYVRSALDPATRARIQRKLREAMTTSQLYRDSRLTLHRLCQQIKESPHYVSQVINQDLDTSFYDFVNLHRIERAREALLQSPEKTVIEIALEVGFNSKSTFNAAFRRHAGTTPTGHRNAHRASPHQEQS